MEIDELEMLREQVRIQAEFIGNLQFDLSRQKAIIAVLIEDQKCAEQVTTESDIP